MGWALEHRLFMLLVTIATIVLTVRLYTVLPKGFLPLQDTGILIGSTLASPDVSFQAMVERQRAVVDVVLTDPAVASVGSTVGVSNGWSSINRGNLTISLKPLPERHISSEAVIARLREPLEKVAGVQTTLFSAQDLRGGGRQGGAQYQYALITQ
ncbi:MAG TPA: efflux RND transporter permease subunit, partial [Ktedonobacterales bacterium]|nr:efflux RND transporter permease subunit [Ktedonobacterales bacterium]